MTMTGEIILNPKPWDQLRSFPEIVQSLDHTRPVEELAFDNIHHLDDPYGENNPPLPVRFVSELLVARTNESKVSLHCEAAFELAQSFYEYAGRLRQAVFEQQSSAEERKLLLAEINRRTDVWYTTINQYIRDVPGAAEKLHQDRVKMVRSRARLRI